MSSSGVTQALAPHLFRQHFFFPLQSASSLHLLEQTQGPDGLGQVPGFSKKKKKNNCVLEMGIKIILNPLFDHRVVSFLIFVLHLVGCGTNDEGKKS